ncbi:YcbK family protein, partial [Oharaeibacter diazotrophicus]
EADPTKIAVPEEPIDDGLEHDFVNVYSSKPDAPVEAIPGLPGVSWEGNLVLASRGDDGDPRGLFGGEDHPFARTVPGIPRQIVQAANGLLLAHSAINVSCIKPDLLGLVRRAEGHFGHKVVVTSGYRSPAHNRRVHGARHSQHMFCNALDLFMPGVARDDLARFFFAQPDRGGIGLYCHTRSIHIDTGRRRQWRWACRGRGRG